MIEALNNKVSVVSFKELADKSGFLLTMSDGSTITLKHGPKGDKGDRVAIGTKKFGTRLYWTLDGEFLLDEAGDKIPVTGDKGDRGAQGARGPKGATGNTPIVRVNTDGYWEMSFDSGTTWTGVRDTNGRPVSAVGPQGEAGQDGVIPGLSIQETQQAVIIRLNGDEFVIPKGGVPSHFDLNLLIGQWDLLKHQYFDSAADDWGAWEEPNDADFPCGYHFMDDSNGAYPYWGENMPIYFPFDYTVIGDKLFISELAYFHDNNSGQWESIMTKSQGYYLDTLTIIQLDQDNLILEYIDPDNGRFREHFTRGVVPNPLSFVAEYNLAPDYSDDFFVDDLTYNNISGYYNYYEAAEFRSGTSDFVASQDGEVTFYYLPRIEEWQSIVPNNTDYVSFIPYISQNSFVVPETVMVQGNMITMTSDFITETVMVPSDMASTLTRAPSDNDEVRGVTYALRYKGTSMVSAWKYEYVRGEINSMTQTRDCFMKVTSRSLFGKKKLSVREISDEDYWMEANEEDVVRYFPACGYVDDGMPLLKGAVPETMMGIFGNYLSSTPVGSNLVALMHFDPGQAHSNYLDNPRNGYSVRLFTTGIKLSVQGGF